MKAKVIFTIFLFMCISSYAQRGVYKNVREKLNSLETESVKELAEKDSFEANWRDVMPLDVTPDDSRYQNMRIGMTKRQVKKYIKVLQKFSQKAIDWEQTAKRENVRNFGKPLGSGITMKSSGFTRYSSVSFTVDGKVLKRGYLDANMRSFFIVDEEGNCFIQMHSYDLGEFRITDGKTYESTTTAGNGGLFGLPTVVGRSKAQEITTYKPGGFSIYIRISEIKSYITMLQNGLKHFNDVKAEKRMFK